MRKKNAGTFGDIPIFLSEFFNGSAQGTADQLAVAVDQGVNAVTYWHYADTNFTGQPGWFMYPESVTSQGKLIEQGTGVINSAAWVPYSATVADGSFWGAQITGGGGAKMDVLALVPKEAAKTKSLGRRAVEKGC